MGRVLLLRSCRSDMTSRDGFKWPESGPVECPDWDERPICGGGLHGLLLGQQEPGVWYDSGKVIVFKADEADIVSLGGKAKARRGVVVYCGDMAGASACFAAHGGAENLYRRMATGGYGSTLTGGYGSTLTGGDWSTLTGGYESTLTGGDRSTLTGGYGSTLTGGDRSTLTGGDRSTLTGGDRSTLTGGYGSTLTGGYGSTLTGGDRSTLTGRDWSTLTGGDESTLIFFRWDGSRRRIVVVVGYVGENSVRPNTPHRLNRAGEITEVIS